VLSDSLGMAMTYSRAITALQGVKETVDTIHHIWLDEAPG
jgi:hypothetical protein